MKIKKYLNPIVAPQWLFVIIAATFGLIYINILPPMWGIDETSHFARAYQIAHGDVFPNRSSDKDHYGGLVPSNFIELTNYVVGDLINNKGGSIGIRKDVDDTQAYAIFMEAKFSEKNQNYIWSAGYSPVAYVGPVVGIIVASLFNMDIGSTIFLARLASLVFYISLVWLSLRLLSSTRLKWLFFSVALLPTALFQASVVTADSVAIGLSIVFLASLFKLLTEKAVDIKWFYFLAFIAVLLPLVKVNYIFLSLGILLVPNRVFRGEKVAVIIKTACVVAVILAGYIWSALSKVTGAAPVSQRPDGLPVSASDQLAFVISDPLHFILVCIKSVVLNSDSYLQSITNIIGWNWVAIPYVFIAGLCMTVVLAALYAKPDLLIIKRQLLILNVFVLLGIGSIYAALYIAFNPVGYHIVDGIQGRYFLPFLIPLMMLIAVYLPIEIKIRKNAQIYIFTIVSAICLFVSASYYYLSTY